MRFDLALAVDVSWVEDAIKLYSRDFKVGGTFWGTVIIVAMIAAAGFSLHPDTPLPRQWNVTKRLQVSDPLTFLTQYKLQAAAGDSEICPLVLADAVATFQTKPDLIETPQCGIEGRLALTSVGAASMVPVDTSCAIALRLAMWERHGVQPAARQYFGVGVSQIEHFSSYSCRQIRTVSGGSGRMSLHATAEAIDVSGFRLDDGSRLSLKEDYHGTPDRAAFFEAVRDAACDWFETTLGPEYNALHADHFHLQSRGWGTCK